eukprot:TRINITY_DN6213_c0_g1_i13.p1 TRINITY_DN6213_c0_g1~~TRINITY_DN6213_c0_g1_i13.p1  ORF type:complete len:229 (-),score=53.63 TRINITY_DN6213_c0_g1_i13:172-858(-)
MMIDDLNSQRNKPCFLWAQNVTHVFLKVKFAPTLDNPGAGEIQNVKVTLNYDRFAIQGLSLAMDPAVLFQLGLSFFSNIDEQKSLHYTGAVGTYEFILVKSPARYWKNLHTDVLKTYPNQYFWWEMFEKSYDDLSSRNYQNIMFQRELDIDEQEDENLKKENLKAKDFKLIRKRREDVQTLLVERKKNTMYCWDKHYKKRCSLGSPFDWYSWFQRGVLGESCNIQDTL